LPKENDKNITPIFNSLFYDIRKIYLFKDVIGNGKYGTVRVGYKKKLSDHYYAVKSIKKKNLSPKELNKLNKEVEILSSLDHPNIIKFYETFQDENFFHIVMELCYGNDLIEYIKDKKSLTENKTSQIISKILYAVNYLHGKGICHRDLKLENILFKENKEEGENEDLEIKIIDFGLSCKSNDQINMKDLTGTSYYISPEAILGSHCKKCDIWSIGVIAFILLVGVPPFNGKSDKYIFDSILNKNINFQKLNLSHHAIDFLKNCLCKDPEKRFSAQEALNHEWFKSSLAQNSLKNTFQIEIFNNLINYQSSNKIEKILFNFLVNYIEDEELNKINIAFKSADINKIGLIENDSLIFAIKKAGLCIREVEIKNFFLKIQRNIYLIQILLSIQ